MKFECDCCGLCCMNLQKSEIYADLDRGDGVCRFLDLKTHLCSIYDSRPDKCNIDKMYDLYFKDQMSREEFYELNYKSCREFKEVANVSDNVG